MRPELFCRRNQEDKGTLEMTIPTESELAAIASRADASDVPALVAAVRELQGHLREACKSSGEWATKCGHAQGELLAIGWQGGPDKVVAGFREENERLRAELAALRAELAATPPTLEWLRQQFGGQPETVVASTGYDTYRWSCGIKFHTSHNRVCGPSGLTLPTRAAVLAAVTPAGDAT